MAWTDEDIKETLSRVIATLIAAAIITGATAAYQLLSPIVMLVIFVLASLAVVIILLIAKVKRPKVFEKAPESERPPIPDRDGKSEGGPPPAPNDAWQRAGEGKSPYEGRSESGMATIQEEVEAELSREKDLQKLHKKRLKAEAKAKKKAAKDDDE